MDSVVKWDYYALIIFVYTMEGLPIDSLSACSLTDSLIMGFSVFPN